ncbi:unnamed protein product, partial [Agarophyton chilense]
MGQRAAPDASVGRGPKAVETKRICVRLVRLVQPPATMSDAEPPATLNGLSQSAVSHALTRAHKRKRARYNNVAPADSAPPLLVQQRASGASVPYQKRRRTSLIPLPNGSDDGDSNDEWEEHVHVDQRAVHAASASASVPP